MERKDYFVVGPTEVQLRNAFFHYRWKKASIVTRDNKRIVVDSPEFVSIPRHTGVLRIDIYKDGTFIKMWRIPIGAIESILMIDVTGSVGEEESYVPTFLDNAEEDEQAGDQPA